MNKVFYIIALIFSVVFFFIVGYYVSEVSAARSLLFYDSYMNLYSSYGNSMTSLYSISPERLTEQGGIVCLFFFLFFIFVDIMGLVKVKTPTTRVLSIIGIALGGLFILWDLMMMSSPGSMSFDEVGIGFLIYALIAMAFSLVGLIQSIKFSRVQGIVGNPTDGLLDS